MIHVQCIQKYMYKMTMPLNVHNIIMNLYYDAVNNIEQNSNTLLDSCDLRVFFICTLCMHMKL